MFAKITRLAMIAIISLASGVVAKQIFGHTVETTTEGDIQYEMIWNLDGVEFDADGAGWTVESALGYTVHVEIAYLVSYTMQLVECADHTHNDTTAWLSDAFIPNSAEAGHGDERDSSLIDQPIVEDFASPTNFILGQITVPSINYCQGHYLVARAYDTTQNLPNDVDMLGSSLYMAGTYTLPNSAEPQEFIIDTNLANGILVDLVYYGNQAHVAIGGDMAQIQVIRALSTLFDTVDFATMEEDMQSKAVLWQLIDTTQIEIKAGLIHLE